MGAIKVAIDEWDTKVAREVAEAIVDLGRPVLPVEGFDATKVPPPF